MKKILILIFIILFMPDTILADVDTNNNASNILMVFKNAAAGWTTTILPSALWLFWALVAIDFVLTFGFMAIKGTDFAELFYELIRKIIIIGFFLLLFTFTDWLLTIPDSFAILANSASGVNIAPDTILEQSFIIVKAIWDGIGLSFESIGLVLAGIIVLIAFALMAAQLFITIVKIYALMAGAYIVFALGGLTQTRSYAINPIISIIKAGMELFFIKVFLGLSVSTIQNMAVNVGTDNNSVIAMIGISVLLASLVHMVPGMVESLLSGHFAGNSTAGLGTAKVVAAAAVGGAMGVTAGAISGSSAINAAKELSGSGQGSTLGNLAKAAGSDAINTITGANKYAAGNMGVRMANSMSNQSDILNSAQDLNNAKKESGSSSSSSSIFSGSNNLDGAIKSANGGGGNTSSSENGNSTNSSYVSGVSDNILRD